MVCGGRSTVCWESISNWGEIMSELGISSPFFLVFIHFREQQLKVCNVVTKTSDTNELVLSSRSEWEGNWRRITNYFTLFLLDNDVDVGNVLLTTKERENNELKKSPKYNSLTDKTNKQLTSNLISVALKGTRQD